MTHRSVLGRYGTASTPTRAPVGRLRGRRQDTTPIPVVRPVLRPPAQKGVEAPDIPQYISDMGYEVSVDTSRSQRYVQKTSPVYDKLVPPPEVA